MGSTAERELRRKSANEANEAQCGSGSVQEQHTDLEAAERSSSSASSEWRFPATLNKTSMKPA